MFLAISGLRDVKNRIRHHFLTPGNRFPARNIHKTSASWRYWCFHHYYFSIWVNYNIFGCSCIALEMLKYQNQGMEKIKVLYCLGWHIMMSYDDVMWWCHMMMSKWQKYNDWPWQWPWQWAKKWHIFTQKYKKWNIFTQKCKKWNILNAKI